MESYRSHGNSFSGLLEGGFNWDGEKYMVARGDENHAYGRKVAPLPTSQNPMRN